MILKKVCLLGDFAVGKTSLVRRFVDQQFSDRYLSTVGVKISRNLVRIPATGGEHEVQLVLWDLEGAEPIRRVSYSSYLRGAHAAIVVGDVIRPETITHITMHIESVRQASPSAGITIALNKSDLLAANHFFPPPLDPSLGAILLHQTSAKTGDGVNGLFVDLARSLLSL